MGVDHNDLRAARKGDHDAFGRIYDAYAPLVASVCRRRYLADPDDALQETFLRAYRKLDDVEGTDKLAAWLCAIARNVCSERVRSATRRQRHEERAMAQPAAIPKPPAPPDDATDHREQLDRLTVALDQLADDERLAIHLHYIEPDPIRAAKDALGLSRSGFYKLLARAKQNLAATMRAGGEANTA